MECKNGDDPAVNAGRRCYIWVVKHAANVPGIYFHNKVANANYENLVGM